MKFLMSMVLFFGIVGLTKADGLTNDDYSTEFESAYEHAQLCVEDIKLGSTVEFKDPYIQMHVVNAVDVRCSNVLIHLYNLSKTPNKLEDYIGNDDARKNKFEIIKSSTVAFSQLIKTYGTKNFPSFLKTWNAITRNADGPPSI